MLIEAQPARTLVLDRGRLVADGFGVPR